MVKNRTIPHQDIFSWTVAGQPFYRELGGRTVNLLVRLALLPGIWVTQCGFKGFKREAAKIIFSQCTVDRFAFDLEVLWLAKKLGFTIKEIPVTWINDPHSTVRPYKDGVELLKLMTFLRFKKKVHPSENQKS